ncbi:MAG: metalloprotease family protein [Pseudomonadota bacterium]|nr:metalloprotease family protein [Pseudomonadota bacterium]
MLSITALLLSWGAVIKYFLFNDSANPWHAFFSLALGALLAPLVHEIVHVFSWPTKKRLRWTLIGFAPVIKYRFIRKLSTAWMTVRTSQSANIFTWSVISPFVLLGLGVALLSAQSSSLHGIFLAGLAGANIVGSYNDLCVVIELWKAGATEVRDEPFGFYWC